MGYTFTDGDIERFWRHVDRGGEDECWEWTGARNSLGYGHFYTPAADRSRHWKSHTASRVSLELHSGSINWEDGTSRGLFALHHCDNPPCVNPRHLYVGTLSDNARDMSDRGHSRSSRNRGESNPRSRLTSGDVMEIREMHRTMGRGAQRRASERFGVSKETVNSIIKGRSWQWLPEQ